MIVVTGRMVQSLRRVLAPAGLHDPVICYQGAAVVAADGTWLLHAPIERELAREAIAAVEAEGYDPNVYVGDELYVSRITPGSEAYANFQLIPIHEVGDVKAWLPEPPTKIVCVGDPDELDRLLNGKAAMPPFKSQLSQAQIADVAAYVVKASRQG